MNPAAAMSGMEKLGSVLLSSFDNLALRERIAYDTLKRHWHSLCGEPLSLHTFPADLKGGVLTLNVDAPLWLRQVTLLKTALKDRLQSHGVVEVRARLGRVSPSVQRETAGADRPKAALGLSSADAAWVQGAVSGVGDEDLREVLSNVIARSLAKASRSSGPGD
jgi:hypothetical protein